VTSIILNNNLKQVFKLQERVTVSNGTTPNKETAERPARDLCNNCFTVIINGAMWIRHNQPALVKHQMTNILAHKY